MIRISAVTAIAVSLVLAGCAQQEEEPPVIRGEPTYDKFGGINGCEDGYIYVPGAAPIDQCLPPDDDCDPVTTADGQTIPCPPPVRNPNDPLGGDDPDRTPVDPIDPTTGAAAGIPG